MRDAYDLAYTRAVTGRAKVSAVAVGWLLGLACDPDSAPSAPGDGSAHSEALDEPPLDDADADADGDEASAPEPAPPQDSEPSTPDATPPGARADAPDPLPSPTSAAPPLELRRTTRATMVYVEPQLDTAFRGKIPHGEVFELLELVEGEADDCRGDRWGRIGAAAYVCLRYTETVEDEPVNLPATLADGLAPFFYARLRGKDGGDRPAAPIWRSRRAMLANAEPEGFLEPEHDYVFVQRRRLRRGTVLTMPNLRVVRESDVRRLEPSKFAGRDVVARPVPSGTAMAWSIQWPFAILRAEPRLDAAEVGRVTLHAEALAREESQVHGGKTWIAMAEPASGWALAEDVRRWDPLEPPAGVDDDELWIDVDLDQQMLALRRGDAVEFLTLISSGTSKHSTPLGLFRVEGKWAFADMRSRADDDESYFVEGVPWVQYFKGRYALHGTFWHNRFGHRTSHGCINLSAHDARWVYERTWPQPKPGWLVINEHAQEPGTLLRIRKGSRHPPDRRDPLPGA